MQPDGPEQRTAFHEEQSSAASERLDIEEQLADEARDDLEDTLISEATQRILDGAA
jgi:hypothetical protein